MSALCKVLKFLLNVADATLGVLSNILEVVVDAVGDVIDNVGDNVDKIFSGSTSMKILLIGGVAFFLLRGKRDDNRTLNN